MGKINVCHVVSALRSGGAESMIYNYSKYMSNNEYQFHILYQYEASEKNLNEFRKINCKLKQITDKKKNIFKNYKETKEYFVNNKIDIVHSHMTIANFIPLLAAKKAGIKVRICHSHETNPIGNNIIKKAIKNILKKLCVLFATDLVACGNEAGKYLYGKKQFKIFNNAIDLEKYKYNETKRKEKRNELGIAKDTIIIGHIGRFIDVKNHYFILKMFKKIININPNALLILIGNGELEQKIKEMAKTEGLEQKIVFTGIIENTYDYYNAFDLFILPSKREGLPMVALEAQVAGLKCFFSNTIDQDCSIVGPNCSFLPLEIDLWVSNILKIKNDYNRNKSVKEYFTERHLNIEEEYQKLDKFYKERYND